MAVSQMKLTFKTLQQKTFTITSSDADTILEVKKAIEAQETLRYQDLKLILKGKILQDDQVVGLIGVLEKDFIVCMVTKAKAVPVVPVAAPVVAPVVAAIVPVVAAAPVEAAGATGPVESTLATGSNYEMAVSSLVEMGFPRDQVVAAMRAAFNNPDRAAEYLMTGIPDSIREVVPPTEQTPAPVAAPAAITPSNGYVNLFQQAAQEAQQVQPVAAGDNSLEFLRSSPQFQQLRQMVQAQPHLLQPLLQQLGQSNPQLIQLISQNQDQFMQMMAEGAGGEDAPEEIVIAITAEENEAVARLEALGFDRNMAIEAYLACDKNEELAANYLFDLGDMA